MEWMTNCISGEKQLKTCLGTSCQPTKSTSTLSSLWSRQWIVTSLKLHGHSSRICPPTQSCSRRSLCWIETQASSGRRSLIRKVFIKCSMFCRWLRLSLKNAHKCMNSIKHMESTLRKNPLSLTGSRGSWASRVSSRSFRCSTSPLR